MIEYIVAPELMAHIATEIRLDRLRALAIHLLTGRLIHKAFNFQEYNCDRDKDEDEDYPVTFTSPVQNCLTSGCAMGELPGINKAWRFDADGDLQYKPLQYKPIILGKDSSNWPFGSKGNPSFFDTRKQGMAYFGLTFDQYGHLFIPHAQEPHLFGGGWLDGASTKEEVAEQIQEFCKLAETGEITFRQSFGVEGQSNG